MFKSDTHVWIHPIASHPILRPYYERFGSVTSAPVMVPSWGHNPLSQLLLEYRKWKVARWRHLSLLARLYAGGVDSTTSCQAERNFSILNRTVNNLCSGLQVDKVEWLKLPRLNKQLIPETNSLRDAAAKTNIRTLVPHKAVTGNAREAAAAATAPGAVGSSDSSTTQIVTMTGSGPQCVEVMDLS